MTFSQSSLVELEFKYKRMLRLRSYASGRPAIFPPKAIKRLARQFPGVLREMDRVPKEELQKRLVEIRQCIRAKKNQRTPDWIRATIAYHNTMRAALKVRAIYFHKIHETERKSESIESLGIRLLSEYQPQDGEPLDQELTKDVLKQIIHPASGRMNAWIMQWSAQRAGVSQEIIERVLTGGAL